MHDDRPKVGLFSMWFNREDAVEPSLESILSQTYENIRFVLVDDGSTDTTSQRMRVVAARHPDRDIEIISWPNRGFTVSLRDSIAPVACDYVAIHDAGDVSHPTRIARQVELAESDHGIALIGCHVGVCMGGKCSEEVERAYADVEVGPPKPGDYPLPGTHGAALFRRDIYDRVGGYRAAFRYCQDSDLWLRMLPHGALRNIPDLLHWRYESPTSISGTPGKQIVQRLYLELVQQCAEARNAGQPDLVDTRGADAVFFLRRTSRLARLQHHLSKQFLSSGHIEESRIAARIALEKAPDMATKIKAARQLMRISRAGRSA